MKTVSREDIDRLGLMDATVHACLTAQKRLPGISREDMLMAMVWYLVEDKRALSASLYDFHANRSPPGIKRLPAIKGGPLDWTWAEDGGNDCP